MVKCGWIETALTVAMEIVGRKIWQHLSLFLLSSKMTKNDNSLYLLYPWNQNIVDQEVEIKIVFMLWFIITSQVDLEIQFLQSQKFERTSCRVQDATF